MSDSIPQSFKVEWLNTTLKFIKNDSQLIMEYPEMPISHVEYLHNLMWQRKNDVGFGFKSLYAPLWEAMKIFSLKYRFKVSVTKYQDNKGQLLIEKILKTTDREQNQSISSTNEDSLTNRENVVEMKPDKKNKKKKQTKGEKYIEDKCKIIESISPTFLRPTLQRILEYLSDEKEASLIFTDLAPIEAKFLENFLGIYNRRHTFQRMLSPACNDILSEIRKWFIRFDQTLKLEIDASKNMKTTKREVTFLKVPRYVRPTMTRAMLKHKGEDANSCSDNTSNVNPRSKFLKALSVNEHLSTLIKTPHVNIKVPSTVRTVGNTLEIKVENDHFKNNNTSGIQKAPNTINNLVIDNNVNKPKHNVIVGNNERYKGSYTNLFRDNHRIAAGGSTIDKTALNNEKDTDNEDKEIVKYYILHSEEKIYFDNNISNNKIKTDKEKNIIINNSAIDKKKIDTKENCSETSEHSNRTLRTDNPGKSNTVNNLITDNRSSKTDEECSHKISGATSKESNVGTDNKTKLINSNNVNNNTTDTLNNCNIDKDVKNNKEVSSIVLGSQSSKDKTLQNSCKNNAKENTAMDVSKFLKDPNQKKIPSSNKMTAFEKSTKPYTTNVVYGQEKLCQRKTKLIEAMSVPLESDKALRMMQRMGWQGGALGLRGEGITEPIMPMLHLAPGAGLGHVSEKSIKKQADTNFHIDILETILYFLDENISERVVKYKNEISKKEKRFLKSNLITFNKRTKVCLPSGVEYSLGEKIVNKMIIDCNLFIDITIKSNNKEIILKKIYTEDNIGNKTKDIKKKTVDTLPEHNQQSRITSTVLDKNSNINSNILKVPAKKLPFKQLIINKILELMETENEYMKINFDSALLPKYCQAVEKIASNINKKQKFYNTCVDQLPDRVLKYLGNISLKIELSRDKMSCNIRQKLCKNHCINSATSTCSKTSQNSEENNNIARHNITYVNDNVSLSQYNKDNESFITNNKSPNGSDELDKDKKHEVLKHKSGKDFHENEVEANNCHDVLNPNNFYMKTVDSTNGNNQQIELRDTSQNDLSVCTNSCGNDIKSIETLPPTSTIPDKKIINSNILKVPDIKHRFKLLIVNQILEFIDTEMKFIKIKLDRALQHKYCKSVEKIVSKINKKQKFYSICVKNIPERVLENLGKFSLNVEFSSNKQSFTVRKIFNKDEETFITNDESSNGSDELDNNKKHEVLKHKSGKDFHENVVEANNCYDVLNPNNFDMKTVESTNGNNQQIELRDTSHNGMSVCTNSYGNDIINVKTGNIATIKSNDANNNRNETITASTEIDKTFENIDNTKCFNATEIVSQPIKEFFNKKFEIDNNSKDSEKSTRSIYKENDIDKTNTLKVHSIIDKSIMNYNKSISEAKLTSYNSAQKILIIEKLTNQSSTQSFKAIQNLIANKITEHFVPQLKCHGIHNLGVIYSCYNEETYLWLKEVLSDYKITDYKNTTDKYTVQIKINTMLDVKKVLTLLELCNEGLCCDDWTVLEEKLDDCSNFVVDIDDVSFNNVCDNNFKLSIGVDEAQFSLCCLL